MSRFTTLSRAMALGFVRDRTTVFFTVLFPLMFLALFGLLFGDSASSPAKVIQVGPVALLDQVPAGQRAGLGEVLEVTRSDAAAAAIEAVRKGDAAAAVEQHGDVLVAHYSAADPVQAGTVRGVLDSLVQSANLAGVPTRFSLDMQQVEDRSLKAIQYLTPGLLGWAIATGATFGAAMTLVTWRQKKILRRLRLAPIRPMTVVGARIGVSMAIALVQFAVFVGVALLPAFGLRLNGSWWMAIPLILVGTLGFLSVGLLAGAWAKTAEAASAVANLVILPMAFLSGAFFPLDNAPAWLRTLSDYLPLKHLNEGMLDVMARGQGPASVLPEMAILAGFTVVLSLVAIRFFRWDDV